MFDLNKLDLNKEVEKLKKLPGQERGTDIKFLVKYIKLKEGEEGFGKVKKELAKLDYRLPDIGKIDDMEWIPSSIPTILMVASAKVFNWREKDLVELGKSALSHQFLLRRLFMKYFLSPEKTFQKAALIWPKQYSQGRVKIVDYDKEKRKIVVRIINFKKHPVTCLALQGIFTKMIEMVTGSKKISAKETKCVFRGDPYHEYVFQW